MTLYGISNCDTVRKARQWLEQHDIAYRFHDYREDGISRRLLGQWVEELGWEALLNKRSTTWRRLDEQQRDGINRSRAIALMAAQPTLIRRPLLDTGHEKLVGFAREQYRNLLG